MPERNLRWARLETVIAPANLTAAWVAVKGNRGAAGVDRMNMEQSERHFAEHGKTICDKILAGTYVPGAIRPKAIPKPQGGERMLGIPNITDRVIQQAIHQVISAVWEPCFSDHSYGYRPRRGAHDAVKAAAGYVREGKTWQVDIDLKSFFDQVSHDKLMHLLRGKIEDKKLRALIGAYLRAPVQHADGTKTKRTQGTPQGGPLSPLLANIYLDPLDKELEKRGLSFVRYADDIAIFVKSERSAKRVFEGVADWIEKHLKVPVNRDKSGIGPSDQSSLLGFTIELNGDLRIAKSALSQFRTKVRELWDARQSLTSTQLRNQWRDYVTGWWNYFQLTDRRWDVTNQTGWIRRHMRKCFWLRWKTPRGRINALKRLGVNKRALGNGYSSRGAWPMATHWVMNSALKNKTLARYGFVLPWEDERTAQAAR